MKLTTFHVFSLNKIISTTSTANTFYIQSHLLGNHCYQVTVLKLTLRSMTMDWTRRKITE